MKVSQPARTDGRQRHFPYYVSGYKEAEKRLKKGSKKRSEKWPER